MGIPGGLPAQRPDQLLQPRSRAGTGPAPSNIGVFSRIILTGAGAEITGPDFILDAQGLKLYNGTPAAGNLVYTVCAQNGTDSFGNVFPGDTGITQFITANSQSFPSNLSIFVRTGSGATGTGGTSFTGLKMDPGTWNNQPCQVYNISPTASLTYGTQAVSNVAGGAANVISPLSGSGFVWSLADSLWFPL